MNVIERYEESYCDHSIGNLCAGNAYVWAAEEVFGMFTYDNEISELFVKEIFEVLDVIIEQLNFEYIQNEDDYIKYLRVCMLLDRFEWIDWGSSIRGAYLDAGRNAKDIIEGVPFTPDNLVMLMNFVEKENENGRTQNT